MTWTAKTKQPVWKVASVKLVSWFLVTDKSNFAPFTFLSNHLVWNIELRCNFFGESPTKYSKVKEFFGVVTQYCPRQGPREMFLWDFWLCEMEVFRSSWPTSSSYECAQVYLLWIPRRSAYVVFSRGTSSKDDHVKTWQTNDNCHLEDPRIWYTRISSFNLAHIWSRGLISKPKWLTINQNPT